jgi:peptide chain release factor subunit 1
MAQNVERPPAPSLAETLDRLARFEPVPHPVISLYLNAQPDQHGKDQYGAFLRKELHSRARSFPVRSPDRDSFEKDAERIRRYLSEELPAAANGVAVFACHAMDLFEAVPLEAAIPEHRLSVDRLPRLYPLARVIGQHPRYAVALTDRRSARLFVFGRGRVIERGEIQSPSISRTSVGGWSQMRYQRHVENLQLHHVKELVGVLERVVAEEGITRVVLAGEETTLPVLREQLSKELQAKVVEVLKLDVRTSEPEIMRATAEALREKDAKDDAERVERALGEYRAGDLAVAGPPDTLEALRNGQVDELLLTAAPGDRLTADLADELVAAARQTSAGIRFIEDPALLETVGGVVATLRYRIPDIAVGSSREKQMSKKINVNPDHYKTKGRERPGEDVVAAREKRAYSQSRQNPPYSPAAGTRSDRVRTAPEPPVLNQTARKKTARKKTARESPR